MSANLLPVTFRYVIDTCSLVEVKGRYPKDVFPGVWEKVGELAESGTLASTEPVFAELSAQDDEVFEWAKLHHEVFLQLDEDIQSEASRILKEHPELVDLKRKKSAADPFVVATAIVNSCAVVTEEKPSRGSGRERIPDVCRAYDVECMPVLEMFRREGLRL